MTGFLTPTHVVLLLLVALMLFGAKRLPELGRSLGSGMREFKQSISGGATADQDAPAQIQRAEEPTAAPPPPAA